MTNLLILLFIIFLGLSQSIDIYVDSAPGSSLGCGTLDDPFKTLDQAFTLIKSLKAAEKSATIFIRKNEGFQYTSQDLIITRENIESLTISAWNNNSVLLKSEEDCLELPIINGFLLNWKLTNITSIKLIGLNIIDFQGQILMNKTNQVVISGSCLKNSRSGTDNLSSLNLLNNSQLTIEDTIFQIDSKMHQFVGFLNNETNSRYSQVSLKNISVVTVDQMNNLSTSSPCFDFMVGNRQNNIKDLIIKDIRIKLTTGNDQTLPFIGKFSGFKNLDIDGFYVENQKFSMPLQEDSSTAVFQLLNNSQVTIVKVSFVNNTVLDNESNHKRNLSLFTGENNANTNLREIDFSDNSLFQAEESFFRFGDFQDSQTFGMKNVIIKSNKFEGKTSILNFPPLSQYRFQALQMSNVTIQNNSNTKVGFDFLTIEQVDLTKFNLADFKFTDNNLTGKIFSFEKMEDSQNWFKTYAFSNVLISNCKSDDLDLLYLYAEPQTADLAPKFQWTTVLFTNLSILNSTFTGKHKLDWQDQDALLQVLNAKLYVGASRVIGNSFDTVDFIVMKSLTSSVFLMNSSFDENNFTRASLIITEFDKVFPLECGLCSTGSREVNLQYRFTFVLASNFTNLKVSESPLFMINTPYLIMTQNTFEKIESIKSELITTRKFSPVTCGNKNRDFARDLGMEEQAFTSLDPTLLNVFQKIMNENQMMPTKYVYMISRNKFEDLTLHDKGVILLKDYNFYEGGVILFENSFTNIRALLKHTEDFETINLIQTAGQILNFNLMKNTFDSVKFFNSLVKFSNFVNNTMLILSRNSVVNYRGNSAFLVVGTNMNTTRILQNNVTNSEFKNNIINIEVIENTGMQTWYQNSFTGNCLNAVDKSLWDVEGFKKMVKPVNPMRITKAINSFIMLNIERHAGNITFKDNMIKDSVVRKTDSSYYHKLSYLLIAIQENHLEKSFVVMTGFQFMNNTYLNSENYSFMKELNGLFSILASNSWFVITNSTFEDINMTSNGNSLFYAAATNISIWGCNFHRIKTSYEGSIFDLMTIRADIIGNYFQDIELLSKTGIFVMNQASPLEGIDFWGDVLFLKNYFKDCWVQGNLITVNSKFLNFTADGNTIADSFIEKKPVFNLTDTVCSPCLLKNNSFIFKNQNTYASLLYQISHCEGEVYLVDTRIYHENPSPHFDSLLMISKSPGVRAEIVGLEYVKSEETHAALRLAHVESGMLTVKDLEVRDMKYYGDQNLIQVLGEDSTPVSLNISNMTANNLHLEMPYADDNGLISFDTKHEDDKKSCPLSLYMSKSKFMDITGISAVSLKVPEMDFVLIENCTFERIESPKGPVVNSLAKNSEDKPLKISKCIMSKNTAWKFGGAIYIKPTNYSIVDNIFSGNQARKIGGTIYLADHAMNRSFLNHNTFSSSSAPFGKIVGSSIRNLELEFKFGRNMGQYVEKTDEKIVIRNASSRGIELTSLNITFTDFNGRRTLDLNSQNPLLILNFRGRTSHQLILSDCTEEGCFIPRFNLILSGEAHEVITVNIEYQSAVLYPLLNSWKISFEIELRACVNGEYYNEETKTCNYCPKGTFSMSPNFPCQNCPLNANCSGGNSVLPKTGFWKSESEKVVGASLVECKQDGILRCEGGSKGCANGFTGTRCQQCDFENGYVESGLLNCKKCKDFWKSLLLSGGGMLLYMIYKAVCIGKMYSTNEVFATSNQNNNGKEFYRACEKGYYVKLLMVYSQILSLIFLFNGEVKGTTTSLLQIGNPSEFILVNLQCSLRALGVHPQDFLYVSTTILLISPVVQIILIILLAKIFVKSFFPSLKMSQFARLTIVYVILLEQPGIVGNLTAFLSCSHDKITGADYITLHPNWSCNDPRYLFFKGYLAIPFLAFWAVIIPLFMFFSLYFRRRNLEELKVRGTWGALYNLAKTSHYYWGTVVMILSLSISYTSYTFQEDPKTNAFTVFLLLLTYQFSVRVVKPFRFATFNFVETVAFNLLMLSVVLGYFGNDMDERSLKLTAYGILSILDGAMFIFLGFKVFDLVALEYIYKAQNKLKKWFGVFGVGGGKSKEENSEDLTGEVGEDVSYVKLQENGSDLIKLDGSVFAAAGDEAKKESIIKILPQK